MDEMGSCLYYLTFGRGEPLVVRGEESLIAAGAIESTIVRAYFLVSNDWCLVKSISSLVRSNLTAWYFARIRADETFAFSFERDAR